MDNHTFATSPSHATVLLSTVGFSDYRSVGPRSEPVHGWGAPPGSSPFPRSPQSLKSILHYRLRSSLYQPLPDRARGRDRDPTRARAGTGVRLDRRQRLRGPTRAASSDRPTRSAGRRRTAPRPGALLRRAPVSPGGRWVNRGATGDVEGGGGLSRAVASRRRAGPVRAGRVTRAANADVVRRAAGVPPLPAALRWGARGTTWPPPWLGGGRRRGSPGGAGDA